MLLLKRFKDDGDELNVAIPDLVRHLVSGTAPVPPANAPAALDKRSEGNLYLKESASKNSRSSGGHCHNFQVDFSSSRLVPSSKISSRPGSKLTLCFYEITQKAD
ncbi:MAG: hypothetical protein FRX49_02804 [Trebouxia sp. A1-2]|nr:MAG: hypothetical protein FRX49_02804 [Trebouxia sp. A1-2]